VPRQALVSALDARGSNALFFVHSRPLTEMLLLAGLDPAQANDRQRLPMTRALKRAQLPVFKALALRADPIPKRELVSALEASHARLLSRRQRQLAKRQRQGGALAGAGVGVDLPEYTREGRPDNARETTWM
jgi:hypothetical protein